jgi:hypothetical protein
MKTLHLPAPVRLVIIATAMMLSLSGCALSLVSSYDEVTDRAVQELASKTEAVIADATTGGSYRRHAAFYAQAQGEISAIEMRSAVYQNNEAEIAALGSLRTAMKNMGRIHQIAGSLRPEEADGVRSLLRSLIHHQISKKRSSHVLNPPAS